jgi:hypothetical protein
VPDIMTRGLLLLLSLSTALSVSAGIVLGPEQAVSPAVPAVAAFAQTDPAIASDGDGFLAVWRDNSRINAARLSARGELLDPVWINVVSTPQVTAPAVVFVGGRYLVAWGENDGIVRARYVGRDGRPMESIDLAAGPVGGFVPMPRAASNGDRALIAWERIEAGSGNNVHAFAAAIADARGVAVPRFEIARSTGGPSFDVAAAGDRFAVVYSQVDFSGKPVGNGYPSAVIAVPVGLDGRTSGRITVVAAETPVFSIRAASNGSSILAAWATASILPGEIRASRIGGAPFTVAGGTIEPQALVGSPGEYLLIYGDRTSTWSVTIPSFADRASPPEVFAAPSGQSVLATAAAFNGRDFGVAQMQLPLTPGRGGGEDLYGAIADGLGHAQAAVPVALSLPYQNAPDLASDGRLAVWYEQLPGEGGAIVGALPGGAPFVIGRNAGLYALPHVGFDGDHYLVVWRPFITDAAVVGARVSRDGRLLDQKPIPILVFAWQLAEPQLDCGGGECLLVAVQIISQSPLGFRSRAVGVRIAGATAEPPLTLGEGSILSPAVTAGAIGFLAAWNDGAIVAGAVVPHGSGSAAAAQTIGHGSTPRLAFGNGHYLLATQRSGEIDWAFVSESGFAEGVEKSLPAKMPVDDIAGSGGGFLMTWDGNLAQLAPNGEVVDVQTLGGVAGTAALAADRIEYSRSVDGALTRVFTRRIELVVPPRRRAAR